MDLKTETDASSQEALPSTPRALLGGAVDYAGLFPPAALPMESAVRNYASYRASDDAWALGRFVVPVARLDDFAIAAQPHLDGPAALLPWPLSALVGAEPEGDALRIREFNKRHAGRLVIDAVELKASTPEQISRSVRAMPDGIEVYVELPVDEDPQSLIKVVRDLGAYAKIRTGGVTAEMIPSPPVVARFLARCVEGGLRFKATAGLHHPLRARYPLTYEPESAQAVMYGYVNVILATALLRGGADEATARAVLKESDPRAFRMDGDVVTWREHTVPAAALAEARRQSMAGFGSCSFREPVDELFPLLTLS